ncbi:hypothetical protein BLJAPNOD_01753 [Ensifer sp. M14]|nr:hypothetical protein BLJAPNOD_01753 [Ensifer sp. M14]
MTSLKTSPEPACQRFLLEYGPNRPGIRRASLLSVVFTVLLGTGLHLELLATNNWNSGEVVLLLHILLGLVLSAALVSWIGGHVRRGMPKSQRRGFSWLSWLLLTTYAIVVLTGLMMVLPSAAYLAGWPWFWRFETTHMLTFLHLWAALAAGGGLVAHLGLRHWGGTAAHRARTML